MYKKDGEITKGKLVVQPIVRCVDDSLPPFSPDSWITNGSLYAVDRIVGDFLDNDKMNFIVYQQKGELIIPSEQVPAIRSSRFEQTGMQIFLN